MAKKDKSPKKSGKAPKLPKAIGGVKLSKPLRKVGGKLLDKANSPHGRQAIAAGLALAASAAAARARSAPPAPPTPSDAPDASPSGSAAPAATPELGAVVDAFGAATTAFMNGLFGRKP